MYGKQEKNLLTMIKESVPTWPDFTIDETWEVKHDRFIKCTHTKVKNQEFTGIITATSRKQTQDEKWMELKLVEAKAVMQAMIEHYFLTSAKPNK